MGEQYADGNLVTDEVLDQEVGLLLGDRAFVGNHPVFTYLGDAFGSATKSRDYQGLGLGTMSEVSEEGAVGITRYLWDRLSATVSRRSFGRRVSNMLRALDPTGRVRDPVAFAMDAVGIYQNTLMQMIVDVGTTFTNDQTPGSGVDLDWQTFRNAKGRLVGQNAAVAPGSVLAVLGQRQWQDLEDDMAAGSSVGDAMSHAPEGYNILLAREIGYQGRYYGVDVFTTNKVPTANAGADLRGFMIAPNAIVWSKAPIIPDPDAIEIILQDGTLQVEFERDPQRFAKNAFFNALLGMAKGFDEAGCTITSDA
jgi:hypothetical protein